MRVYLRDFHGLQPNRASRLEGANYAEEAYDANLWNGQIRNFPEPTVHCSPNATTLTITKGFDCCLNWATHVDVVRDCDAVFWTGDGTPKMATTAELCAGAEHIWSIPVPMAVSSASRGARKRWCANMMCCLKVVARSVLAAPSTTDARSAWSLSTSERRDQA